VPISTGISLLVVGGLLGAAVALSLLRSRPSKSATVAPPHPKKRAQP
jgi:hypothetical protein